MGLNIYKMPVNTATLPRIEIGICHVMMRFHKRYTRPISNAKALISPRDPLSKPISMFWTDGKADGLYFKFANTVAEETASIPSVVSGDGHVVI